MRKQVLVSVDRGETRVAIVEGKGAPTKGGRRGRPSIPKVDGGWRVAELYIERRGRRSIVGNVYKGRVDNVLAGMEAAFVDIGLEKNGFLHVDEIVLRDETGKPCAQLLAARGRGRGGGTRISELLEVQAGDHRPGDQGPDRHEGRAPLDGDLDPGPLPRLRAGRRRGRRLAPASRLRARAAAQARRGPEGQAGRRSSSAPPRTAPARATWSGSSSTSTGSTRCSQARVDDSPVALDGVPGGRPSGARRARRLLEGVRPRDHRRPQAAPPRHQLLRAHRARAGRPRRALRGGRAALRAAPGSRTRSRRRCRAGSTCRTAATS